MLGFLAAQSTEPIAMLATAVAALVAGGLGGGAWERRRNGRRNNNPKAGHGDICNKHGDGISANTGALKELAAYQENFYDNQKVVREELTEIRKDVKTLLSQQKE